MFLCILLLLARLPTSVRAQSNAVGKNLISNGSFEDGVNGWLYYQWAGKKVPGRIDTTDKKDGKASFKMHDDKEPKRTLAKVVHIPDPSKDYVLSMWLKTDGLPPDAAIVRVGIEGRGWLGTRTGHPDRLKLGGTVGWRHYAIAIHAGDLNGSKKVTIFIYDNATGQGTLGIDGVALRQGTPADVKNLARPLILRGDTSKPDRSIFAAGEPVQLKFTVSGISADAAPLTLDLNIIDEHNKPIESKHVPVHADGKGNWKTAVAAPHDHLGFYRVKASLSNGVQLEALGSRPAGFLTYIVVPDPSKRVDYGEKLDRFGMQGAPWGGDACKLLGVRWVLDDGLWWIRTEPHHAGEFDAKKAAKYASLGHPGSKDYRVRTLNTLFMAPKWACVPGTLAYNTGKLTPDGEKAWARYCKVAAKAYMKRYPNRQLHIFQITWEPIQPWGFKGTDKDLIRIYQIAYQALHQADPKAVVAGPCRGINNNGDPAGTEHLFKLGLAKYIDAYIVHPYFDIHPERHGMAQAIRAIKKIIRRYAGKDLPMYGSEQGWSTKEDPSLELEQARGLMRQNLITLGEGFQFNFAFTFCDYRLSGQKGYGYNYNLVPSVPFGPKKTAPKPIAAAYAAQSFLLEGSTSVGAIDWLGDDIRGYAFERPDSSTTLALWCYAHDPHKITLPTGSANVTVYDWMGNPLNPRKVKAHDEQVELTLGPEPVYVQGVAPTMWGRQAKKIFALDAREVDVYPGDTATISGHAQSPTEQSVSSTLLIHDPASGIADVSQEMTLPPHSAVGFKVAVKTPPQLSLGRHPLAVRLHDGQSHLIAAKGLTLNVIAPLALRIQPRYAAGGNPSIAVKLTDRKGAGIKGHLRLVLKQLLPGVQRGDAPMIDLVADPGKSVAMPNTDKRVAFTLPAGGHRQIVIDWPKATIQPAKPYQVLATVTTDAGITFSITRTVHFLGAPRAAQPPSIDGDLADWPTGTTVALSGPGDVVRNPKAYAPSFSAELRYAWDDQNLYLAARVNDDRFIQTHTGVETWKQDCLQLAFNLDPDADATTTRRTCEINVALTPDGPQALRSLSWSPVKAPTGPLTPKQCHVVVRKSGAGNLTYEIAIPWTTLGLASDQSFHSGDNIAVAATVNEVRRADQSDPCALGLYGGITPNKNPNDFGRLILQ